MSTMSTGGGGVNLAGAIGRGMSFNLPEIAMIADPWQSQPIGFTSCFGCLPTGAAGADETGDDGLYQLPSLLPVLDLSRGFLPSWHVRAKIVARKNCSFSYA
jgi:hypothetical protein